MEVICNMKNSKHCSSECDHYNPHESEIWCEQEEECPDNHILCKCVSYKKDEDIKEIKNTLEYKSYVVPIRIYIKCEKCKDGNMISKNIISGGFGKGEGITNFKYTVAYHHYCNKCGYERTYDKIYPYIDYEDK